MLALQRLLVFEVRVHVAEFDPCEAPMLEAETYLWLPPEMELLTAVNGDWTAIVASADGPRQEAG